VEQYTNPETRPSLKGALSVLPEALGQGTGSYVGSELLGKGVKAAAKPVVPLLQKSAATQYMKALSPTKAQNKFIGQRIAPEMIRRGVSGSLEKINSQASSALEDIGPQIDEAINKQVPWPATKPGQKLLPAPQQEFGLPEPSPTRDLSLDAPYSPGGVLRRAQTFSPAPISQAKTLAIQPVLDALESYKQEGIVNGVKVDPNLVDNATQLQQIVKELGPEVSYQSLNRVRQIWDKAVARSGGYAGKTLAEGSTVDAMREGASAIRDELAKDRPDIAKLNAEYSFWSKVQQVTGDTIQRRSGQEGGLMPKLAGIGGAATGHTPMGVAMYTLGRIIQSPRWRTFSAIKKTQIANAIAAGDAATVTKLIGLGASAARLTNSPEIQ
jgi:hypothetical protein